MVKTTDVVRSGARIPRSGVPKMVVLQATPAISYRGVFKPAATSAGTSCKAPITSSTSWAPGQTHGARTDLLNSVDYFEVTCPAALVAKSGCAPTCCVPGGPLVVPTFPIPPAAPAAPSSPPQPQGVWITSASYYSFQAAPVRRSATPVAPVAAANGTPLR